MKKEEENQTFLLSESKKIIGNRSKVREKVFQILVSYYVSRVDISLLFEHIFFRDFFEEEELTDNDRKVMSMLGDEAVKDFISDARINWTKNCIEFGTNLIDRCNTNNEYVMTLLKENSERWDIERMHINDKVLLIIGVTEMLDFPQIPLNTTIDEMVKIAKKFSTDKSYVFVNGLLMKIKTILLKQDKIKER